MQDYQEDIEYEVDEESAEQEDAEDQGELFDNVSVFEARWFVICLVVVAPLWIWPFDFPQIFAQFGISILKAAGWLVGITLAVVLSSVILSAIGNLMLKSAHPQTEND